MKSKKKPQSLLTNVLDCLIYMLGLMSMPHCQRWKQLSHSYTWKNVYVCFFWGIHKALISDAKQNAIELLVLQHSASCFPSHCWFCKILLAAFPVLFPSWSPLLLTTTPYSIGQSSKLLNAANLLQHDFFRASIQPTILCFLPCPTSEA
jgi:hypothetical protein